MNQISGLSKRTVPQGVFDSPQAQQAARAGHRQACKELASSWRRGDPVDEGDPNHPKHNGGVDHRFLFGSKVAVHMAKQY